MTEVEPLGADVPSTAEVEDERRRHRGRRTLGELGLLVVMALGIAVLLRTFVGQAFSIPSESMTPQLEVGDRVVVSMLAYDLHDPNRGDVVVFDCPPGANCPPKEDVALPLRLVRGFLQSFGLRSSPNEEFIKRVVGLPGESVEGREGAVFIDGRRLVEPYLPATTTTSDFEPVTVPDGMLWVMGDNRTNSSDSRVFGPVEQSTVVGRAVVRLWPPTRTAFL